MPSELAPSDDGKYIVITAIGDTTRASAAEGTRAAYELGMELGIRCVLIDVTKSRNIERVTENVRFTKDDAPPVMPPDLCFAALVDPSDHSHDFHVAFAKSQGIDITMFWEREEAIAHLIAAAATLNNPPTR
jgi:hypothetical protein